MLASRARLLDVRLLGRHQLAAVAATAIDFAVMITLVELLRVSAPAATLLGALAGGVSNFTLSRVWAFAKRHDGSLASQAWRYAMVCAGGALLNAGAMAVVLAAVATPYALVRVAVSILVSALNTYPLHTRVVFRVRT